MDDEAGVVHKVGMTTNRFVSDRLVRAGQVAPDLLLLVLLGILPLLLGSWAGAEDENAERWDRFLGSQGHAASSARSIPTQFTEEDFNWKIDLPGKGHSSPVIWGERLFLTQVLDEQTRAVSAFSVGDGSELWRWEDGFTPHNKHNFNEFASSTPCLDRQHVYLFWTSGTEAEALALTHEGSVRWRQSLGAFHGDHGSASSPVLADGVLFLFWDDLEGNRTSFAGLNPTDGTLIWRKDLPWRAPDLKTTYSTPLVRRSSSGQTEVIVSSMPFGVQSFDPRTGAVLWRYDLESRTRTVASPVEEDGVIFATWGSGNGAKDHVALIPGTETKDGEPEVAWRHTKPDGTADNKGLPYVPTPLAHEGLFFMWTDAGLLQVLRARTGEVVHGPKRIGGRYFSNPLLIGDFIYCANRDQNELVVVEAEPEFEVVSRNPLGSGVNATPAVAHGTLFIRTNTHLISVGGE